MIGDLNPPSRKKPKQWKIYIYVIYVVRLGLKHTNAY